MADESGNKDAVKQTATPEEEVNPKDAVTEEILRGILESLNRPDLELIDFDAKPGTVAGDNYASIIYAVKLNMKRKDGKTETIPVMLKVLPRNELRQKMIKEGNIFLRDVYFYEKIAPALEKFQKEIGLSEEELVTPWPKCYSCKTDGTSDYLAMDNLREKGFRMGSRQLGLDFDHCAIVLKTLARFHAVSYAMFKGDYDKILEQYPWLHENMFVEEKQPPQFNEMMKHTFTQLATNVRDAGEPKGAEYVEGICTPDYFDKMYKIVGGKVPWSVIGHGDCWTNNILFKYDEETKKPIEVKLVDYQITRVASRAVDLHYFFYSSPQIPVLNEREEELADVYYTEFTNFVKRLGVDTNVEGLTKKNFLKEIETFRYFGCVTGLFLSLVTSADSADVPEMESITEEDLTNKEETNNFLIKMMKERGFEKVKNIATVHLPKCPEVKERDQRTCK